MYHKAHRKGKEAALSLRLGDKLRKELIRRARADGRTLSAYARRVLELAVTRDTPEDKVAVAA